MKVKKRLIILLSAVSVLTFIVALAACAPQTTGTDTQQGDYEQPEPDEYGVVTAEQWKDIYPDEYESYQANLANSPDSGKHNYLEMYPALSTLYAGFGFAKGYDEASSHLYTLESVKNTPRISEASTAACITCKSPQFTAMVNSEGEETYKLNFLETVGQFTESVSCYNCHANDPENVTLESMFFVDAMGSDTNSVPIEAQACGQCHNEYYFADGITTNPYTGLSEMTAEAMLAYYDEKGFSDWMYPDIGTPMLKTQHPEFETIYGGDQSNMARNGYSCADCHMGTVERDDGTTYVSHLWQSPLENAQLLENDCSNCHEDLPSQVKAWQEESEDRVQSISLKLEEFVNLMKEKVASGALAGDQLTEMQTIHRSAQWYWDFVMVENSEGAHNPALSTKLLDKAEALVDEGLEVVRAL